jgi:hypothetical protein
VYVENSDSRGAGFATGLRSRFTGAADVLCAPFSDFGEAALLEQPLSTHPTIATANNSELFAWILALITAAS